MPKRRSHSPNLFSRIFKFSVSAWVLFSSGGVGIIQRAIAVDSNAFPEGGTYKEQEQWVHGLTNPCSDKLSASIRDVVNAENPFAQVETQPEGVGVKVWRHDFDPEFNVVTRRTTENNPTSSSSSDTEEVLIGGGEVEPVTFHFKRMPDGYLKTIKREKVSVKTFAEGIERATTEGLVVKTTAKSSISQGDETCYSAEVRNKRQVG